MLFRSTVRAAGAIAEHFLLRGDRVSLRVLSSRLSSNVPAASGSGHLRRILDVLASVEPRAFALGLVRDPDHAMPHGSLAIMLSPLISPTALQRATSIASHGANVAVIDQLPRIHEDPSLTVAKYVEQVKNKEALLFGFGHAVYHNFDPRANVLKKYAAKVLDKLEVADPMLDIARELEAAALDDPYFAERKLYPNVDFYSATTYHCIGLKLDLFTPMFALSRLAGWSGHVIEQLEDNRLFRPTTNYVGPHGVAYTDIGRR